MKAFLFRKYKAPLELAEVPLPSVGPHDVLIKVAAAGVNKLDDMLRKGEFKPTLPYRLPVILGDDVAGEVVEVGSAVSRFKKGDLVFGKPDVKRLGTYAEYAAVDESELAFKPASMSWADAGSFPLVGLTAWQAMVIRGGVHAGQKVLIHGGAGGVGALAIQLAKHLGATVATTASASNAEFVKELGADIVIDYRTQNFAEILSGYDLVLDTQGGETLLKSLQVLHPGGKVIGITGPPDEGFARASNLSPVLRTVIKMLSSKVNKKARSLGVTYEFLFVQASGSQLAELSALIEAKKLRHFVSREFSFAQTPEALEAVVQGKISRGKAVVLMSEKA